jgi:hypothetical protein
MRVAHEAQLHTRNGHVAILDALALGPYIPPGALGYGSIPGTYPVYATEGVLVFDGAPRLLKAKSRGFPKVGEIPVPSGDFVIVDGQLLPDEVRASPDIFQTRFPVAALVVWVEEKEYSVAQKTRIIGIGPSVRLLLAGADANDIHQLEKRAAQALRMKGPAKQRELELVKAEILEIHWQGSKDSRLRMLASAMKLELPPRWKKRGES